MTLTKKDKAVVIVSELYRLTQEDVIEKYNQKQNPVHRHVNKLTRSSMAALDDAYDKALAVRESMKK